MKSEIKSNLKKTKNAQFAPVPVKGEEDAGLFMWYRFLSFYRFIAAYDIKKVYGPISF